MPLQHLRPRPEHHVTPVEREEAERLKWVRATSNKNYVWPTIRRRCPRITRQRDWQTPTTVPPPVPQPRDYDYTAKERMTAEKEAFRKSIDHWKKRMHEEIYGPIERASPAARRFAQLKNEGFRVKPDGAWRNWYTELPKRPQSLSSPKSPPRQPRPESRSQGNQRAAQARSKAAPPEPTGPEEASEREAVTKTKGKAAVSPSSSKKEGQNAERRKDKRVPRRSSTPLTPKTPVKPGRAHGGRAQGSLDGRRRSASLKSGAGRGFDPSRLMLRLPKREGI